MSGGTIQSVECVPVNSDSFKGKVYQWVNGDNIGLCDIVSRTVLLSGKPFLIFESGFECSILDVEKNMIMVDYAGSYVPALQAKYNTEIGTKSDFVHTSEQIIQQPIQQQPETNPIKILVDKANREVVELSISLTIKFIPKQLYNVIMQSFDTDTDELFNLVIDDQDKANIMTQIANKLYDQFKI